MSRFRFVVQAFVFPCCVLSGLICFILDVRLLPWPIIALEFLAIMLAILCGGLLVLNRMTGCLRNRKWDGAR